MRSITYYVFVLWVRMSVARNDRVKIMLKFRYNCVENFCQAMRIMHKSHQCTHNFDYKGRRKTNKRHSRTSNKLYQLILRTILHSLGTCEITTLHASINQKY